MIGIAPLCFVMVAITDFVTNTYVHGMIQNVEEFAMTMPNVIPNRPELYLCTPVKIDPSESYYITGFKPKASMNTVHHMILYGCAAKPGSDRAVWNCGEMTSDDTFEQHFSPCGGDSEILYAWARDAPQLKLPAGVGFKVGAQSRISYLVLQIHYGHVDKFEDGTSDSSGVILEYTKKPLSKLAGVYLMGTGGSIPPHSTTHMDCMCNLKENKVIHPIAYRTHTHSLGRVVSGYRVRIDENGDDHWMVLGKRNPLSPQMFYPVINNDTIVRGDMLAARCTMVSDRNQPTKVGSTNQDEMCNFYLLYWVDHDTPLEQNFCFTSGPPMYSWLTNKYLKHIPNNTDFLP